MSASMSNVCVNDGAFPLWIAMTMRWYRWNVSFGSFVSNVRRRPISFINSVACLPHVLTVSMAIGTNMCVASISRYCVHYYYYYYYYYYNSPASTKSVRLKIAKLDILLPNLISHCGGKKLRLWESVVECYCIASLEWHGKPLVKVSCLKGFIGDCSDSPSEIFNKLSRSSTNWADLEHHEPLVSTIIIIITLIIIIIIIITIIIFFLLAPASTKPAG